MCHCGSNFVTLSLIGSVGKSQVCHCGSNFVMMYLIGLLWECIRAKCVTLA